MSEVKRIAFRELIDSYKSTRTAWEANGRQAGTATHAAMNNANDLLVKALNNQAGIPDKLASDEAPPMVGVIDDDGHVFVVVDNGWGECPVVEAFLPAKPSDVAHMMSVADVEPAGRSMFMETLNFEPAKDLIHIGLIDCGPDEFRPEVDGETLNITLPLSQFEPLMDDFSEAFASPDLEVHRKATLKKMLTRR